MIRLLVLILIIIGGVWMFRACESDGERVQFVQKEKTENIAAVPVNPVMSDTELDEEKEVKERTEGKSFWGFFGRDEEKEETDVEAEVDTNEKDEEKEEIDVEAEVDTNKKDEEKNSVVKSESKAAEKGFWAGLFGKKDPREKRAEENRERMERGSKNDSNEKVEKKDVDSNKEEKEDENVDSIVTTEKEVEVVSVEEKNETGTENTHTVPVVVVDTEPMAPSVITTAPNTYVAPIYVKPVVAKTTVAPVLEAAEICPDDSVITASVIPDRDSHVRVYVYENRVDTFGKPSTESGRVHFTVKNMGKFTQHVTIPGFADMGEICKGETVTFSTGLREGEYMINTESKLGSASTNLRVTE